jgi:ferredoxin-like protein FixX
MVAMMKVIERVEARYEIQDVEMGKVYRWCPANVLVGCGCGERLSLTASMTSCAECGTDHAVALQEELSEQRQRDEALHPWRYSEDREDGGIPV